jgi:CubicO group peptidase (beta-lactamase class C family)
MTKFKLIAIFCLIFFLSRSNAQTNGSDYVFPDTTWKFIEKPDTLGWNIEKLVELEQFIINKTNITGLMVIYKGKVLYDFGDTKELSYIASCRKSILSMLYGQYVEKGIIDLSKTMADLAIDDNNTELLETEKKAKVENLLTVRSCVFLPSTESGTSKNLPERGSKEPGSFFLYNNWDFNVAGYVFEKETGKNIYDAVGQDFAIPIKMQDWDRSKQKKEIFGDFLYSKYQEYHMWFSTRDMARLGYLMLREGEWNGKQLIPKSWVKKTTSLFTSVEEMKISDASINNKPWFKWGYGYLWRVWDSTQNIRSELKGAYSATGSWGQYITVIPSVDLVIATKTKSEYRRSTNYEAYMNLLDILLDAKIEYKKETEILKSQGNKTIGQIISVMRKESGVDFFKYRFVLNGQEYIGWSSSADNIFGSGEYTVTYSPDNPKINRIDLNSKIE